MLCHDRFTQRLLAIGNDGPCLLYQTRPFPIYPDAVWLVRSPMFILPFDVYCVARLVVGCMSLLLG